MATNQYIGARYVPVFADPAEWNNTRTYEPLTIVLHEGNSYTSRQYVPIGIDITNTDFWAETGNYNAQVEAYRQEVKTYDGRITANATATYNAQASADNAQASADNAQASADNAIDYEDALNTLRGTNYNPMFKSLKKIASWPAQITGIQGCCIDSEKNIYAGLGNSVVARFSPLTEEGQTLTETGRITLTKSGQEHTNSLCYYRGLILVVGSEAQNKDIGVIQTSDFKELDPITYQTDPARMPSFAGIGVWDPNQTFIKDSQTIRVITIVGLSYEETEIWKLCFHFNESTKKFTFQNIVSIQQILQGPAYTQDMHVDDQNVYLIGSRLGNRRVSAPNLETSYLMSFNMNKSEGTATLSLPYNDSIYNEFEGIYMDGFNIHLVSVYGIWEAITYNFRPVERINTWANSPIITTQPFDFTNDLIRTSPSNIATISNMFNDVYRSFNNLGKITFDVKVKFKSYDLTFSICGSLLYGSEYGIASSPFSLGGVDYILTIALKINSNSSMQLTGFRVFDLTNNKSYRTIDDLVAAHSDLEFEKFLFSFRVESRAD